VTRILVVDDKEDNLYFLNVLLTGHGYQVDTARHGADALIQARKALPALVIADLLMPVMDGYTLLRQWKADKKLCAVPIVIYTATYTAPEDEQLAISLGADAFLVKPIEPDELIKRVRQILAHPARHVPSPPKNKTEGKGELFKQYNEALVRKLEVKTVQLEAANRALEQEMAERKALVQTQAAIVDALPAHLALLDSDGVILTVNEPWRQFAIANGLKNPEFAIGTNYLATCDASVGNFSREAKEIASGIREVLRGELAQFSIEYPCPTKSERLWFKAIVNPVDTIGERLAIVTHIDVTEQTLARITLRKSEQEQIQLSQQLTVERERLVTAQAVAKIGSWETDLVTLNVTWSEETFRIFELSPNTFSPTHEAFLAIVHPDDRAKVDNAFREAGAAKSTQAIDHRIVLKGGRIKFVFEIWQTFVDETGRPVKAVGTCQDVSDRQAIFTNLLESRALLRRSQEISSIAERVACIGSAAADFRTGQWEWSDETYRIYGVSRENFVPSAETLATLVHPDDRDRLLANIPAAQSGITPGPVEYRIKRPDGAERLLRRVATLVRDEVGSVTGIVGTVQDITESRAAEREKKLLQEQLRQSQRLESLGHMTGGVAHDFNNLLTVILGNAEALERHLPKDTPLHELAEITRTAAERGAQLTARLLAFSRQQPLDPHVVDVNGLVKGMDKLLRRALSEQVKIETTYSDDLWHALIDAPQLESALLNLSVNARDAMPEGGTLTIETRNVELDETYVLDQPHGASDGADIIPGQYILIAVSDTGTGMSEDVRLRAFDPFFTTKDVGKGSGLGLSMVYGFVRQSKGHVRIYSEPGHGTTIKLYLPRAQDGAEVAAEEISNKALPGGSEKILVVEDDDLVRKQVNAQLKALGYNVFSAIDGIEALEILRKTKDFDLLFTDIIMPRGMNGREFADEALKLYPQLPVLFTSGYADNALVHQGRLNAGAQLLHKPYRRHELANKIRAILNKTIDGRLQK
jgi:PAS domain S-box-containing protein